MVRSARNWRTENWADFLPMTLRSWTTPVDLYSVARLKHIKRLGLRLMIPRGLLLPVSGGFQVYLRDMVQDCDIDLTQGMSEPPQLLSPRQRFSFAHEIAHTLFYKISDSVPIPESPLPIAPDLEQMCDRTAGHILIPTPLLKREIHDSEQINASFIQALATKFRTSLAVAMHRLAVVESSNPFERCVLLVRRKGAGAEIRASYFGVGLLATLPRPTIYTPITEWLSDFPRHEITHRGNSEWPTVRGGKCIRLTKTELSGHGDFLLEARVVIPPKSVTVM